MVVSVTRRRDQEAYPSSHIAPVVAPGGSITLEWAVGNDGDAEGQAQAALSIFGIGLVAEGNAPKVPVGAGTEIPGGLAAPPVSVRVTWTNSLAPGVYQAVSLLQDVTPGTGAGNIAQHVFNITVPDPTPPHIFMQHLFAVGAGPRLV